ncbi:putative effector of the organization of the beta-glucan layer of the wall [Scheffersomyces coipomensis]|uniref:putative effector of the organization of the beta-glucan layer of the wall n=1 Tax=Scheffersomyces coipomensis TaxID=1788519 RepID=UPI00315D9899
MHLPVSLTTLALSVVLVQKALAVLPHAEGKTAKGFHVQQDTLVSSRILDTVDETNKVAGSVPSPFQNLPTPSETPIPIEIPQETPKVKLVKEEVPEKCKHAKHVIRSPNDIQNIADCRVLAGDLEVHEYKHPLLTFGNIETVTGNIIIRKSPELVRIEAPSLTTVEKSFVLRELTSLSLVSFPSLLSVRALDWRVLPILSNVHFSNEIKNIESITVSDTSLTGFSGFMADRLETLDINNNRFLDIINSNVETIEGLLHIAANAADVAVSLPKLKSTNNMSIHDVFQIDLNSLESVNNSVSMINNHFSNLKLPKLKAIGGSLSLSKNDKLNHVEFPTLNEVGGGLIIVNNSNIDKINFFPKLNVIGGALELVGPIKDTSLKQLKLVKGSALVQSFSTSFDCSKWSKGDVSNVIRGGKIECINAHNEKIISNTPTDIDSKQGGPSVNGGNRNNNNGNNNNSHYIDANGIQKYGNQRGGPQTPFTQYKSSASTVSVSKFLIFGFTILSLLY